MSRHQLDLEAASGRRFLVYMGWDPMFAGFFYEAYDRAEFDASPDASLVLDCGLNFSRDVRVALNAVKTALGVDVPDLVREALEEDRLNDDGALIARWNATGERVTNRELAERG